MCVRLLASLVLVGLLQACRPSGDGTAMQWRQYDKGGSSISLLVPRGGVPYDLLLASRVDTRIDSLYLPMEVRISDSRDLLVLIDTVRFVLQDSSATSRRAHVMHRELSLKLPARFLPPSSGIYKCSIRAIYEETEEGLESWGIAL